MATEVNLTSIGMGMTLSWTSPMLVKLMHEDTQLSERVNEDQASWIVSVGFLSSIVFFPVFYWLVSLYGRKKVMLYLSIFRATVNLLFIFATEVWMLYLVRGVTGTCEIGILSIIPAYSAEIASKQIRGALGTIAQLLNAVGMLIMLSLGPYASYLMVNIVYVTTIAVMVVPMFFVPDSPYCMVKKGRINEALKTLTYLRDSELLAQEEIKEMSCVSGTKITSNTIKDIAFLKSMGIAVFLSIGIQLVGYSSITLYLQTILEVTNTSVSSELVSVIFGVMQVIACFVTAILSDRAGRKPILAITLGGLAIGMLGLGLFFYMKDSGVQINGFMNYLPLVSLVIVVLCYNAGIGSLCIVLVAELFDNLTRSFGISVCITVTMIVGFLNVKYFPLLIEILGSATVFWSFAIICLIYMTFVLFCVPETKQKSFLEIQGVLGRKE
ncbi:unnamed protein product [Pieris brassicae]|uniref:Major facilitator superfamily (MFS) profile domain-containing protein n=1 Tax=Pieris brassicae TaxID=7116 RepID=A0A9P0TPJ9_PIEBR|nr:unnamed protein product [Pieris brassicae]